MQNANQTTEINPVFMAVQFQGVDSGMTTEFRQYASDLYEAIVNLPNADARYISLAKTHLEEAVLWASRALVQGGSTQGAQ